MMPGMSTVAVITGGAGGMGLATARILGAQHHLLLTDVSAERLEVASSELRDLGYQVTTAAADVTDAGAVRALFEQAARLGRVACAVHTAGLSPRMGSAELILEVNARGTINVADAALSVATPGFALVNVASLAGHMFPKALLPRRAFRLALTDPEAAMATMVRAANRGPGGGRPATAYSVSKSFVIAYSAARAAEFGKVGARILSVSPGSFDTDMGRLEIKSGSAKMVEYAALKRFGTPEEIAELLAFCASEKAGYLTGTDILCDGGNRAGIGLREVIALARGR